jgi:hypothetical protein
VTPPSRRSPLEQPFLQSVLYAALFDYPLSVTQLREALIGESADETALAACYAQSAMLQATIEYADGFYFPRGRHDLIETRARREASSRSLLGKLRGLHLLVSHIPFVRMVALSGSLAHLNADGEADLDLFVITAPGRVWSVTFTTLIVAKALGWRRHLCLNYVVSERALMVGPADLFSANQIIHLQPVMGAGVYRRFLDANRFVERFYPNFRPRPLSGRDLAASAAWRALRRILEIVLNCTAAPLYERACRMVYHRHLRKRAHTWQSRDQVRLERDCLKLHTSSHRREVMERFEDALEQAMGSDAKNHTARGKTSDLRERSRIEGHLATVDIL